jgi:hypothetical protein
MLSRLLRLLGEALGTLRLSLRRHRTLVGILRTLR